MSFDLLAPHYRWMEALSAGGRLQRCRTGLLNEIQPPQNVLIYGEGNGRFLVELGRRFPEARVTVVDASAGMIAQARRRVRRAELHEMRMQFVQADALAWTPPQRAYDLIVTCFFLDCFTAEQLRRLVPTIATASTPWAQWLVADFQIPPSGWRRLRSRVIVALLYAFFRRATRLSAHELVDPAQMLMREGFQRTAHAEHDHGLLSSSVWTRSECVTVS